MKMVPKVVPIRRLIQIIFCLKKRRYRRSTVNYTAFNQCCICCVCQTNQWSGIWFNQTLSWWESCIGLCGSQQNVRRLRRAPPSIRRECSAVIFFFSWSGYIILYLQEKSQGNQLLIVLFSPSQPATPFASHRAMLPSVKLNCSFHLITLLSTSISLALCSSVTNAYPFGGFSLDLLRDPLSVFVSEKWYKAQSCRATCLT